MAAPTVISSAATALNSTTTPKDAVLGGALAIGDVLAAVALAENALTPHVAVTSLGSHPLTLRYDATQTTASFGFAESWGGVLLAADADGDTVRFASTSGAFFGGAAMSFSGSGGIGANAGKQLSTNEAGTVSITTTGNNSTILVGVCDWNALDGASRVWATVNGFAPSAGDGTELAYFRNTTNYAAYIAYYPDAGAAGAKTVGVTTPGATMRPSVAAVEIFGTAAAAPGPARTFNAIPFMRGR